MDCMKCSTAGVYVYPPCPHRRSDINGRRPNIRRSRPGKRRHAVGKNMASDGEKDTFADIVLNISSNTLLLLKINTLCDMESTRFLMALCASLCIILPAEAQPDQETSTEKKRKWRADTKGAASTMDLEKMHRNRQGRRSQNRRTFHEMMRVGQQELRLTPYVFSGRYFPLLFEVRTPGAASQGLCLKD